jgi:hypothetical protein
MRNLTLSEEKEAVNGAAAAAATSKRVAATVRRAAVDAATAATHCLDTRARRREATIPAPTGIKRGREREGRGGEGLGKRLEGKGSSRELLGKGVANFTRKIPWRPGLNRGIYVIWSRRFRPF